MITGVRPTGILVVPTQAKYPIPLLTAARFHREETARKISLKIIVRMFGEEIVTRYIILYSRFANIEWGERPPDRSIRLRRRRDHRFGSWLRSPPLSHTQRTCAIASFPAIAAAHLYSVWWWRQRVSSCICRFG